MRFSKRQVRIICLIIAVAMIVPIAIGVAYMVIGG